MLKQMRPFAKHIAVIAATVIVSGACAGEPPYPEQSAEGLDVTSTETGIASWYGPGFNGEQTASGEIYNQRGFTAAHKTLPLRTLARVVRLDTGQSVVVRVNDRGPYAEGRIIDLSRAAAAELDFLDDGLIEVRVEALGPADEADGAARSESVEGE